jgi:gamma-glutamyltranspeptidase / glutathione hydrolase
VTDHRSSRTPVMGRNVVATSQPLAVDAGLRMLAKGGNAIDAAVAAAMTLTVVEPTGCGLGGDAFAIVWDGVRLHGLNSSGRSPAAWTPERFKSAGAMPQQGWESVTVPGVVAAWVELARRFGTLPLATLAAPAIAYAQNAFPVTPKIATLWAAQATLLQAEPGFAEYFLPGGHAPRAGEIFACPALAGSLELIASTNGEAFYTGALAEGIERFAKQFGAALTIEDLAAHRAEWTDLLDTDFAGFKV